MSAGINEIENRGVEEGGKGRFDCPAPPFCARAGSRLGGAHVAVFAMCGCRGYSSHPRTHRKKRDVCATPAVLAMCASGGHSSRLADIAKKRDACATPARMPRPVVRW